MRHTGVTDDQQEPPMPDTDPHGTDLAHRVHVDLPRITPEQMTTSQQTEPPPDPTGGRDVDTEFMIRHFG
ncbi:hypothetical protein [Knoellia aerolata]|uniref:Uncharacterized protein n=1 Tax=Knoellia aerolata DSM 18566 TaxID=1385519 RepID=A0A0A0JT21_9MICO|nr:hypothetical protein [Knoellia aerolata]KGN39839.1 hypothetical protein N801_18780 [Knoellia aerolata DSM 18566]